MNENQHAYFLQRYRGMSTEELVEINVENLTDVARDALNTASGERGVEAEEVAKKIVADDRKYALDMAAKKQAEEERKDRRDARIFKFAMVAFVPVTILGFIAAPERAYGALLSAVVQAVVLAVIGGIVFAVRRARRKKKNNSAIMH